MATGVSPEKALIGAVLNVAGANFTPGISSVVQEVVGNDTATKIITNAVISAGKTAVTGGDAGDAFLGSMASSVANVGADKIISGLSINGLPKEAESILKASIVGTILTGDGTTAMTNAAINAGVSAAVNAATDGTISLTNSVVDSLNNIAKTAETATQDTIAGATQDTLVGGTGSEAVTGGTGQDTVAGAGGDTVTPQDTSFLGYPSFQEWQDATNDQFAKDRSFPDFATYTQFNGDNVAYKAANSGSAITSNDTASVSNASVDDLVNPINTVAPTTIPTGGLSALSDTSFDNQNNITLGTDDLSGKTELKEDSVVGGLTAAGSGASTELPATGGLTQVQQDLLNPVDTNAVSNAGNETAVATINPAIADNTVVAATPVAEDVAEVVSSVPGGSPVGGLTQAQKDLIEDKANDGTTVGGLNQVAATGNDATAVTKVADPNVVSNILKKIVTSTVSGAAKNLIKKAAAPKRVAMPSVAKKLTGSALSQIRSNVAPKKVDISKLMPVKNRPVSLKADVSKLTPVTNISRLSSSTKG